MTPNQYVSCQMDLVFISPTEFYGILSFVGPLCCLCSRPEVWLDSTLRQVGFPLIHQFSIIHTQPVCSHPLPGYCLFARPFHPLPLPPRPHIISYSFYVACVYWWAPVMYDYHVPQNRGKRRLWALRACLITSFTPFGPSGRVTHATVQFPLKSEISPKIRNFP